MRTCPSLPCDWPWLRALGVIGLLASAAVAQPPREDPLKVQRGAGNPPNSQPVGGGVVQQQGRPFYVQGAVTVLLIGGAIWTVCRSSRRL